MTALGRVDIAVVAAYVAVTLVAGLALTRRASRGIEDYFLGGRSLPWYLLGVAGMASWFDLTGTMVITSFLYLLGPCGLYVEFRGGAVLILAFLVAYTGKWHRRSGCMTSAEWVAYRFGSDRAAEWMRVLTALMAILTTVGMLAYLVRGTSLFVGLFIPYSPTLTTAALLLICGIYTAASGFYGVVLTDLVQGVIVITACVAISFIAFREVARLPSIGALAASVTGNPRWTDSLPGFHAALPDGYGAYRDLFMFAALSLLRNVLWGMGTGGESRYFGARSDRDCGLQSLLQGIAVVFRWPLMIGFAVLGLLLVHRILPSPDLAARSAESIRRHYPEITVARWHEQTTAVVNAPELAPPGTVAEQAAILGPNWAQTLPLVGAQGTVNPEQILPIVIRESVPEGLRGLILIAMLAAMMSNLTVTVNGAAALVVRDLYQHRLRPEATNRELIGCSHVATFGLLAGGFWMGINAGSINEIWGWIIMALGGGALAPWVLRFYWWRCNAWGMVGGTVLGGAGAILQRFFDPAMPEVRQFALMGTLSFAGTIFLSLATAPTDRKILRRFYSSTRPFGWWGPLRRETSPALLASADKEHRNDLMSVPCIMTAQVSAFLMSMQFVIHSFQALLCTLPVFLAASYGVYHYWWKNLPPADNPGTEVAPPL